MFEGKSQQKVVILFPFLLCYVQVLLQHGFLRDPSIQLLVTLSLMAGLKWHIRLTNYLFGQHSICAQMAGPTEVEIQFP
ncbi:hypothetical protein BJ138DRAFT_1150511 [Hygrophoropsis aurantiaca]|uniref:Uncharacterized protein n=1 Tax=Hygrophoropsis aurantiaca TaxID=72124 RepID=A0ACB8AEJ4_9AGAM|nr:hypothetical protein BJ138DRAFT_1150511 [Hygrophoropsis aurantiaca]